MGGMSEMGGDKLPEVIEPQGKAMREVMAIETGGAIAPLVPRTLDEAYRLAQYVCYARLAPDSYGDNPSKVVIGILKAMEVGVAPLTGLASIAIINNKPCVYGDLAAALVQRSGHLEKMDVQEIGEKPTSDKLAEWPESYGFTVKAFRRGQTTPYEWTFTVGDAKRAKLWLNPKKSPWMDYPKRMLFNRARAVPLRDGFSDALAGLSIREEIEDLKGEDKKPADTSFLDPSAIEHKPEVSSLVSTPTQPQNEPVAATNSDGMDIPQSLKRPPLTKLGAVVRDVPEPLARGRRILASVTIKADIDDLQKTIAEELEGADLLVWSSNCNARREEMG